MNRKNLLVVLSLCLMVSTTTSAQPKKGVVINPVDLSYRFQPKDQFPSRREGSDPVAEFFKGYCYLFASKSSGYWRSRDMARWEYIPAPSIAIINDYAPTLLVLGDEMYMTTGSYANPTRIFKTSTPEDGTSWQEVACHIAHPHQYDPAFFKDDDGRVYFYWGCSNVTPIMGVEVDPTDGFRMKGEPRALIHHQPAEHGWEQFGADNETQENGWNEGSAMLKIGGKYYLQYASNGTEFRHYGIGCYVSDNPLGPFTYVEDSPFSIKPNGFIGSAGHGHIFADPHGNYWLVGTMLVGQRHMYERRVGLFPVTIDEQGPHAATAMTTYPWRLPKGKVKDVRQLELHERLLSKHKTATASSSLEGHQPDKAVDNQVETWWAATTGNVGEWLSVDLGAVEAVDYVHINLADEGFQIVEPYDKVVYRYVLEGSRDGEKWFVIADESHSTEDAPHKLITLKRRTKMRYVRIINKSALPGKFSVMDLRIFGKDTRQPLAPVTGLKVTRDTSDPRLFTFSWNAVDGADGYILRWGRDAQHLTHAITVDTTTYHARYFNRNSPYAFTVEAY